MAIPIALMFILTLHSGCKKVEEKPATDFQEVKRSLTLLPPEAGGKRPIRLYFYDGQAALLVPVTRFVTGDRDYPQVIFEELIKGPADRKKLARAIPEKTKLLGVEIDNGVLTLDFSEDVREYGGGSATEIGLVNSVLYSSRQIEGVESVQFKIGGNVVEYLPEGTDISAPIPIPTFDNNYDPGPDERKFTVFLPLRGAPYLVPAAIAASTPDELTEKLKSEYTYGALFDAGLTEIEFDISSPKKNPHALVVNLDDSLLKLEKQRCEIIVKSLACTVYNFALSHSGFSAYAFKYNGEEVVMLFDVDLTGEGCVKYISELNLEGLNDS